MASTATTILGLRKQGTGDAEDTWGTELNEDALDLIDEAHGVESIALTGNKTLTSTDYVTNEARNAALRLTDGGLSAAPTITIPAVEKTYIVHNTTTYVVTVSCGGTDATVAAQRWALVYCDGTDVYAQKLFQSEDQASYGGAYEYAFSTTTTDADPGAGVLRLDNATASSATGIYVSDSETGGADISALLLTWDDSTSTVKGYVKLQSKATPATFHVYSVSALTDNAGYMDYTVTHVAGAGAFSNTEELVISFVSVGDKGDTGATGPAGADGADGADGDIVGPATVTDNNFPQWDGTAGNLLKDGFALASQAEAEAGTSNTTLVSPLRVAQAIAALSSGGSITYAARTSNTILGAADSSKLIDITSGTFTQTFEAAATLEAGWSTYIRNSGTGDVTLDPNSSETIDGLTSFVMYPGEVRLVQCDGTNLHSVVLSPFYRAFTSTGTFTKPPGYSKFGAFIWSGGSSGDRSNSACNGGFGGGGFPFFDLLASDFGATETVTVGAGGAGQTSDSSNGVAGGDSSIGTLAVVYGAQATQGGHIRVAGSAYILANANETAEGFKAATSSVFTQHTIYGGAGGPNNGSTAGASSYYGGASGGGYDGGTTVRSGGTSIYGGDGGAGGYLTAGTDGSIPAGGGGASTNGSVSGAGARGEVRIWGVV